MYNYSAQTAIFVGGLVMALAFSGCQLRDQSIIPSSSQYSTNQAVNWPEPRVAATLDKAMEADIDILLQAMSLEQKIGQMIQADIGNVTPDEIRQYRIGSVLNGGGQTPNNTPNATAQEWVDLADRLYLASIEPADGVVPIPLFWGVDAVHGHGNVRGATLFPHNIGLGATRNAALVQEIARATAVEIAATGLDWDFAPTVAVARDIRWGRTFESYSEDPQLVATLGAAAVTGLQGPINSDAFLDDHRVIATAKHFIGDGGTQRGDDQGFTVGEEQALLAMHLPGYRAALDAGVQTVMASYSWWNGLHSHENARLMNDLLKDHLGFDGLIVSDWQAIGYVPDCTIDSCAKAINAGIDLFMIPNAPDWKNFFHNTLAQVHRGEITLNRIDDAVRRILRVKKRAGLWHKPSPSQRRLAGQQHLIGSPEHRTLARQAVRESLVLLKNNGVLPAKVLVTGPGADNIAMQTGGWSVSWQGTGNANDHFPGATSIRQGIAHALEESGGLLLSEQQVQQGVSADVAIVVFGETPYAEMVGDLENLSTLEVEQNDKAGLKQLQYFNSLGIPVVAVLLSGRPLWVNKELNAADGFVAAWLPGTEGTGIADVLIGDKLGRPKFDFKGKLSFSWPAEVCNSPNTLGEQAPPLFPYAFGLSYQNPILPWHQLDENTEAWRYGCILGDKQPMAQSITFSPDNGWDFYAEKKTTERHPINPTTLFGALLARRLKQQNGVEAHWDGTELARLTLRNGHLQNDFLPILANHGALVMTIKLHKKTSADVSLVSFSGLSAANYVNISAQLQTMAMNQWQELSIDLNCFSQDRLDMSKVEIPFAMQTADKLSLSVKDLGYRINASSSSTIRCEANNNMEQEVLHGS